MLKQIAIASTVLAALAIGQAKADTLITYAWSPDATMTLSGGVAETLSGSFVWDATTGALYSDNTTVSGSFLNATFTTLNAQSVAAGFADYAPPSQLLQVLFANSLALGADDPLVLSNGPATLLRASDTDPDFVALSVTGTANVDVPEPASMAILGAGLTGLGWLRRRRAG